MNPNQTNTTDTANNVDMQNADAIMEQATNLRNQANELEGRAKILRGENDQAATEGSGLLSRVRRSKGLRTAKRVLGLTLGVGVVSLVGVYAYSRLRTAGVDVPTGSDIGDVIARGVDAATA